MESRARITLFSDALIRNFKILSQCAPQARVVPMVKADAYGHGAVWAAKTLRGHAASKKKIHAFGVATFGEALELRQAGIRDQIIVFSDCAPWTKDKEDLCRKERLEPVLSELVSLLEFQKSPRRFEIPAHIEVNTGMNRLGVPVDSLGLLRFVPSSVFTHLADSEHPGSRLTQNQIGRYAQVVEWTRAKYPRADLHFANSAALWNSKHYGLLADTTLIRPGLSLYGIRPFASATDRGLRRVMRFSLPILNRLYLERGDQVGYGGTYTCRKAGGEWVAILGGGYADGVFRSLSGRGIAVYSKKRINFLGRVSMDLCAVNGLPRMKVGDEVVIWGDEIDPYEQAGLADTIPYEITTRVGARVVREHT